MELGIELIIDAEENNTEDLGRSDVRSIETITPSKDPSVSRGRSRRASFSSLREIEEDTRISRARGDLRSSVSRLQIKARAAPDDRLSTRATTRPTERIHSCLANPITNYPRSDRGRLSTAQNGNNPQNERRRHASASNQETHPTGRPRYSTDWSAISGQNDGLSAHGSSIGIDKDNRLSIAQGGPAPYLPTAPELLYRPSITQLLRLADTFRQYHVRSVTHNMIERWRAVAFSLQHDRQEMIRQAMGQGSSASSSL